jgi:dihydroorotate dehydrogenase electron transfer subunit
VTTAAIGSEPRVTAPFGRRRCEVISNEPAGMYRLVEAADPDGPTPLAGQFYMLAAERGWGGEDGRPHLARAFSVCRVRGERLGFLVDAIGPGTARLAELEAGEGLWLVGPLGVGFSLPDESAQPLLVAGGVGLAPLVVLAESLREAGREPRVVAGFRSSAYAGAASLAGPDVALATDDGSAGHHGLVTDLVAGLLAALSSGLSGGLSSGLSSREPAEHAAVYACGPPAMLESVRRLCSEWSVPAELALEEAMACGFGACFGCVVRTRGGYRRICVDGPVLRAADLDDAWLSR